MKFNNKNTKIFFISETVCQLLVNNILVKEFELDAPYDALDTWNSFEYEGETFDIDFNSECGTIDVNKKLTPQIAIYNLSEPDEKGYQSSLTDEKNTYSVENIEFAFDRKEESIEIIKEYSLSKPILIIDKVVNGGTENISMVSYDKIEKGEVFKNFKFEFTHPLSTEVFTSGNKCSDDFVSKKYFATK